MSQAAPKTPIQEGDRQSIYIPSKGERVTVLYCYRDIPWKEADLEGIIPNVLVGVDEETDEIVLYPPAATPTIKAWREEHIRKRGLDTKQKEQQRVQLQMAAAKAELEELDRLGLLDEFGCIDEDKYEVWQAQQNKPAPNYQVVFGELRAELAEKELEPREIFDVLGRLGELDPARAKEEAEAYMFKLLVKRTGRNMYEEKRLKAVYEWTMETLTSEGANADTPTVLSWLASGTSVASGMGSKHPQIPTIRDTSYPHIKLDPCLSWDAKRSSQREEWVLIRSHRDAIWAAIADWENQQSEG